jgi:uncharacterized membrane-anchored protein YhcB (DUF1043 family)
LKKLVNENRDVIAPQNEIASDAKEWEEHKRDSSCLYSGARLETEREKMTAQKLSLSGVAQDFIEHGITLQESERKAKETLRQRITIGLVAGIAIAVVLAVFGFYQAEQASNNAATALANEQIAIEQAQIALARQLASQAQSINATRNSKQMLADLLAVQSLKLLPIPNADASSFLINNTLSAPLIACMTHGDSVNSVAFSPDGKYVVSGSADNTARAWAWQAEDLISNTCAVTPRNLTLAEWQLYVGVDVPYEVVCDPKTYPNAVIPEDAQAYLNAQK